MGNSLSVYGSPKKTVPKSLISVAPSLQEQINVLQKRKRFLEKAIEFDKQKVKESKTKEEAYNCLKQKNTHENELKSILGMLDKLEGLDNARERLQFQKDMLSVTSAATSVIKDNMIDAGKAEAVMDDVSEAIENVNEISNILSSGNERPDYQLQEEVEAMFAEKPTEPVIIQMPDVPQQKSKPLTEMDNRIASLA